MPRTTPQDPIATTAPRDRAPGVDDAPTEGRRARQRRELLAAIEAEARRLLDEGGAGSVSMRAIARAVGVAPASLYTYFEGLDDVFTMLLLSSYRRLADATEAGVALFAGSSPSDRALAGILAHRRWALAHPNEFNLLFTDMIPGYEAPPGGPTVEAQTAAFRPMIDALSEVLGLDEFDTALQYGIQVWATFHGAVTLEVNHHLDWIGDCAEMHEHLVRTAIAGIGVPDPSADLRQRFDERWVDQP